MPDATQTRPPESDSNHQLDVVCYGEVLWDSVPQGLFLGGAPFNVAAHLKRLGISAGIVSAVGEDVLGSEIVRRAGSYGLPADLIQRDTDLPTGFVDVTVEAGSPSYVIREPAAWDNIAWTNKIDTVVKTARAFVFGTLAQRMPTSRETLHRLWSVASTKVLDVNLRPPYDDRSIVSQSWDAADVVKLNDDELFWIANMTASTEQNRLRNAADMLSARHDVATVIITRGASGACLLHEGAWLEAASDPVEVVDTIGAGDAFLAGFLSRWLTGQHPEAALRFANRVGGLVASRPGAIPHYAPEDTLDRPI